MLHKIFAYLYAKSRAFAPWSCFFSPRPDIVSGFQRWKWLVQMRRSGRHMDPSIEIRCSSDFSHRLKVDRGAALDKGSILWLGDECGEQGNITIHSNAYIGPYCFLGSCHDLEIGENTMIGGHSYLITVNHRTDRTDVAFTEQGYMGDSIRLGKNVWLGAHVVVLPGVDIGDNAVIGAGAVVTKNVPAGETWVGVPAAPLMK
jgi:acetyltransferase-like isoleucine patch superfamily enzyme